MIQEHHYFQLPDPSTKVWRYLSFTKYLSLLHSGALHFARSDCFEDPWEGTAPERSRDLLVQELIQEPGTGLFEEPERLADEFLRLAECMRLFTYINCWHSNADESDAMWRLYSFASEGVAVQTTVGRLRDCFAAAREPILFGAVHYENFETVDPGAFLNGVTPFIFKRKSFEHEKELRAVIWLDEPTSGIQSGKDIELSFPEDEVKAVPVELQHLIESIVVSPAAPKWFADLVTNMTGKAGLDCDVTHSKLYTPPRRRTEALAHGGGTTFSITRDVIDYLHRQHLQYTELQMRERERLAQRESEAVTQWLADIQREIEALQDGQSRGAEFLAKFGDEIAAMQISEIARDKRFKSLFLLSGQFDNVHRELGRSSIPEQERNLLLRRMIFLYTQTLVYPQVALLAKLQCGESSINPEEQQMFGAILKLFTQFQVLMNEMSI